MLTYSHELSRADHKTEYHRSPTFRKNKNQGYVIAPGQEAGDILLLGLIFGLNIQQCPVLLTSSKPTLMLLNRKLLWSSLHV